MTVPESNPTLLLAEISGCERIKEKLGADEMQRAVLRCLHRMERVAAGFKGQLREAGGDAGLTALFESAEIARLAASEMQQRVLDLPPVSGVKLEVKISFPSLSAVGDTVSPAACLSLRHGDSILVLGSEKQAAAFGRDSHNDIVIKNPRASRNHARIEQRREKFVLIDQSSNGTFVSFAGGPEIPLKRQELILHGCGYISCGSGYGPESDELVEFDCSTVEGQ